MTAMGPRPPQTPLQLVAESMARGKEPRPPHPWRLVDRAVDGASWYNPGLRATVIWSVGEHGGEIWYHVSMSIRGRLPTWDEMVKMKEWTLGSESWAYQVFAPRSKWISFHDVLHLWSPANGIPRLPDFGAGGSI